MANIFLTRKCNLKCPYCFADEFVNKENEEFSIENFKKVVEFIKADGTNRIGLIGGEPTVYSHFKEVIEILNADEKIKTVIIYTNGLNLDKYLDILGNEKIHFLINCNSASDIGEVMYEKLKSNIKAIKEVNKNFTLGINIYSKNMDYQYIFELLKIADSHTVRFSTALPNDTKEHTNDILAGFKEMKPVLRNFWLDCKKNDISPNNDCNSIPDCLLDVEDKRVLLELAQIGKKYECSNPILSCRTCSPVIDILPDMTAVRCFGLSKYMKASINNFKSLDKLISWFYNKIDLYARLAYVNSECENCKHRLYNRCGVCFTYKIHKFDKIKELVRSI